LTDNHAGQPRMSPLAAVALAREQGGGQSSTFLAAIATGLPCSPRSWARRRSALRRSSACRAIRCLASNMWLT
jgi:hypothetical protein